MTKPMSIGCIKLNPDISWRTFNILPEPVDLDNPVGHLCIVDIEFDHTKATPKQITYNEIYPPIIEKQKILDVSERSTYHLLEQYTETSNGCPKNYRATKKAHATLFKKKISTTIFRASYFFN